MVSFLSLKGKVWTGYILAFLLLLISYFLIFYTIRRSINETNAVSQTYNIINHLKTLRSHISEAESGMRAYMITQDSHFLASYKKALENIPLITGELKTLMNTTSGQRATLDSFMALVNERISYMESGLAAFRTHGLNITDSMRMNREPVKKIMDSIRLFETRIRTEEEQLMQFRKEKLAGFFNGTQVIAIITVIIAFITLLYSLIVFNKENKDKEKAIEKATGYSVELESNIAELKEANQQLQELKSLEKFTVTGRIARTIAHEVRNPLTNISLATEQLQETIQKNPDSGVLLEMISRNASRINQLVSELLNATRFAHLEYQKIDVSRLLEETLEMAKDRIELNHIGVEKNYSADPCMITVDAEKIKLALLNIIVNAIEAMEKDKGLLTLKTKKQGNKCIIEIRDNGKGMDEEVLQNLFEPYFTGKSKGNGLGLTNTQNIIFNHKGSIKVYSKPGQGATFMIILDISEST